jgi:hypothetical protein
MSEYIWVALSILEITGATFACEFFLPRGIANIKKGKELKDHKALNRGIVFCLSAFFLFSSFVFFHVNL